jgi:hypothetical protein
MNSKKWIKIWISILMALPLVGVINYVVDPYGIYNTNYFSFDKIAQVNKIKLIKAIKTKDIKPSSISLGNSRADGGYDPTHKYFTKPSYNIATGGGTLYENKKYLNLALKQNNLKKVLLVVNYRIFNEGYQTNVNDFETYFNNINKYKYLLSLITLKDSFLTLIGASVVDTLYNENGQRQHNWGQIHADLTSNGYKGRFDGTSEYYKKFSTNYIYGDTKRKTFLDFEEMVKLCYENNIELDIIFGPSHIRLWESIDYYLGYDKWLKWKKDVVLSVNKIANQQKKKQFRIMDFSVYHNLTAEKIPTDKSTKMKYHWEASHYKNDLGLIVLDRLVGDSNFNDFGVELNLQNIDEHLKQQEVNRHKFIDVENYKKDFEEYLVKKRQINQSSL